ncbi:MAG: enoyl-CoA hydratase/isomerase family protein, partial [Ilumatobacteraceae bacterium]
RIGLGFHSALDAVAAIPRFVIAAVSGYALGGGCELALACDYRIAGEKAVFGQPEVLLGIIPGGGGTQRLPRLVGSSRAKEIVITGRQVKSDEALRIGLADEVVPNETLHERAFALAASVAAGAVQAHAAMKRAIDEGLSSTLADGLLLERRLFTDIFRTDDSQVGVKSFLENGPGKATFSGR